MIEEISRAFTGACLTCLSLFVVTITIDFLLNWFFKWKKGHRFIYKLYAHRVKNTAPCPPWALEEIEKLKSTIKSQDYSNELLRKKIQRLQNDNNYNLE